jgi:predicted dienelactone hydrolase
VRDLVSGGCAACPRGPRGGYPGCVPDSHGKHREAAVRDAAAQAGTSPLILYSHHAGGSRRAATFLCTHLTSHGYIVAALDHSEVIAPELARKECQSAAATAALARLHGCAEAQRFLTAGAIADLARRGVEAVEHFS